MRGLAGSYTRLHSLGQGGMGEVFLVRAESSGTLCALKTLHAHLAEDDRIRAMVRDEARLVSAISHPNVARLIDAGEHDGAPFFVMEHVDGPSFRDLLRYASEIGETVPAPIALRICADACAGLHAAHELRDVDGTPLEVVHRDISPHNVLLSRAGAVKLIDFGVAKSRGRLAPETRSSNELKGKLRYMAPEQALSMRVDRRTDVFGLGAALYHAIVGEAPFDGPSVALVLQRITSMKPIQIPSHVPAPVAAVLACAMHPLSDGRYATAIEMKGALERAITELGATATSADVASYIQALDASRPGRRIGAAGPLATPLSMNPYHHPLVASMLSSRPPPPANGGATRSMKLAALAVGFIIAMTLGIGVELVQQSSRASPAQSQSAALAKP